MITTHGVRGKTIRAGLSFDKQRRAPAAAWFRYRATRKIGILSAAVALFATSPRGASAQVIPGLNMRSEVAVFGTLPANLTPSFAYFDSPVLFGYSLGGYYQTRHILGAEVRGSIQRRINAQHQESALAGPRAALTFGRFTVYSSLLFGAGNGWRFKEPPVPGEKVPKPMEGMGPQWTILGGVDVHVYRRLSARLGEVSYSTLYLKNWDLSPVNVTGGMVLRFR